MSPFWGRFFANVAGMVVINSLFGGIRFNGALSFVIAALVLGVVNAVIRPVVHTLALPISILTFGIFALIVNGVLLGLVAFFTPGFAVDGCGTAVFAAVVLSVVSAVVSQLIGVEFED